MGEAFAEIDVYPVGVLHAAQVAFRALTVRSDLLTGKRWHIARNAVQREWRYLSLQVKARNWRAVRNAFNGYLAEHRHAGHNAGRGWTKRAAIRRVERLCTYPPGQADPC